MKFIYSAKNVYLVASAESPVTITVTRDGENLPVSERGSDVRGDGSVVISSDRLYKLVEGTAYGTHVLEITIDGSKGLKLYTFTFG